MDETQQTRGLTLVSFAPSSQISSVRLCSSVLRLPPDSHLSEEKAGWVVVSHGTR